MASTCLKNEFSRLTLVLVIASKELAIKTTVNCIHVDCWGVFQYCLPQHFPKITSDFVPYTPSFVDTAIICTCYVVSNVRRKFVIVCLKDKI